MRPIHAASALWLAEVGVVLGIGVVGVGWVLIGGVLLILAVRKLSWWVAVAMAWNVVFAGILIWSAVVGGGVWYALAACQVGVLASSWFALSGAKQPS